MRLTKLFFGSLSALAVLAVLLVTALLFLDLGMFLGQIEAGGRVVNKLQPIELPRNDTDL